MTEKQLNRNDIMQKRTQHHPHTHAHTHSILEQSDVQISSDKIPGSTLSEGHYKLKCVRMCETERHSPQSTVYPICLSLKLANGLFP